MAFAGQAHGLPDDAEQPIHFRADNVEGDLVAGRFFRLPADGAPPDRGTASDSATKQVIATGSVQIDQGSMRLEADRVVIESDGDGITLIDAQGDPARYRQQLETGAIEARAANIIYRPADAHIELIGRAWLTRDSDEFRGEIIKYDMRQGKVTASGDQEGVEMILQPESIGRSPQPGSARGNPSQEKSPQPGSARGRPLAEKSPQPGSARVPLVEAGNARVSRAETGSARAVHSHNDNP